MPEEANPGGSGTQQDPPPSTEGGGGGGTGTPPEQDKAYLETLRQEAAAARIEKNDKQKELDAAQAKIKELELAGSDLSEREKLQKQLEDAQAALVAKDELVEEAHTKLIDTTVKNAFLSEAAQWERPLHDLDDAFTFVLQDYREKVSIVESDDGTVTVGSFKDILKDLTEKRPYLIKTEGVPSGRKVAGRPGTEKPEERRAALEKKYPGLVHR